MSAQPAIPWEEIRSLPLAEREQLFGQMRQELLDSMGDLTPEQWQQVETQLGDLLAIPQYDDNEMPLPPTEPGPPPSSEGGDFSDAPPECGFLCTAAAWGAATGRSAYGVYQTIKDTALNIDKEKLREAAHVGLDIAGLVPGPGEFVDAGHAVWLAVEGKYLDAALTLLSAIPLVGDAIGKGAKYALKAGGTALEAWLKLVQRFGGLKAIEKFLDRHAGPMAGRMKQAFREFYDAALKKLRDERGSIDFRYHPEALKNLLRKFDPRYFQIGPESILLDRADMKHFLRRHHPDFWDGTIKQSQTFFKSSLTPDDLADIAQSVLSQNRDLILTRGVNGMYQMVGEVDGVRYVLGINNGHVGQFYPLPGS